MVVVCGVLQRLGGGLVGWMNVAASQVAAAAVAAAAVGEAGRSGKREAWTDKDHQRLKEAAKPTN